MALPVWKTITKVCDPLSKKPFVEEAGGRCDFNAFIVLIKNGIVDLVLVSTLIVVFMLVYVGFKLITSQGNTSAYTDAKKIFGKVVWGYIWVLAAWLIVYTITNALLFSNFNFLLGGGQS
jgi:hypothetical protein